MTGGTGALGVPTVARLIGAGHRVRVLSHRAGSPAPPGAVMRTGDLVSGEGLGDAVAGVDLVVHAASEFTDYERVDVEGTRRLLAAVANRAPAARVVYVSIVGVDRSSLPFYRAKYAIEQQVRSGARNWDILRATQFHNFALSILASLTGESGVVTVPADVSLQPVDVDDVARRLVRLVGEGPAGRVVSFGGPQVLTFPDLARAYQHARGSDARVEAGAVDDPILSAWRSGDQLAPDHADGNVTWEQYLERHRAQAGDRPA